MSFCVFIVNFEHKIASWGHILETFLEAQKQELLDNDDNIDKWMGNSNGKFIAKERKIHLAQWVKDLYE